MTKAEMKRRCKDILHKLPVGSVIENMDRDFMLTIFENHPEWEQKQGVGVSEISTKKTEYGNSCFYLHRLDGTSTDISYVTAIDGKTAISDIRSACRSAIKPIISAYRDNNVIFNQTKCPITNEILTKDNTHIDHYDLTFEEVFKLWISDKSIDILKRSINPTTDNSIDTYFTDSQIALDFLNFHNNHTHLRAVSKKANLSILRKNHLN